MAMAYDLASTREEGRNTHFDSKSPGRIQDASSMAGVMVGDVLVNLRRF